MRLAVLAILFSAIAFGDQTSDRAKLAGSWQLESGGDKGDAGSVWTLELNGDKIHMSQSQNQQKLADWECNTMGRECQIKDAGRNAKVTLYFNGPMLVQLETRGSEVVRRRFQVTGTGDSMDIEVIPITPSGKTETLKFRRLQTPADHQ